MLPEDTEKKALYIYKLIEERKAKTNVAYQLVNILQRDYKEDGKRESLKSKLPSYIIEAIEESTEKRHGEKW